MPHETLDCLGLSCPFPLIKIKERMGKLRPGQILEVLVDDPLAKTDVPGWCELMGHKVLKVEEAEGILKFYIKKA
ncbi:MAG: sulfurtransferase TusA family protein [candidate division NC10 bacterium]|nr:sulfurtransferase TusA family protein [candidate division NC10 bacterium]